MTSHIDPLLGLVNTALPDGIEMSPYKINEKFPSFNPVRGGYCYREHPFYSSAVIDTGDSVEPEQHENPSWKHLPGGLSLVVYPLIKSVVSHAPDQSFLSLEELRGQTKSADIDYAIQMYWLIAIRRFDKDLLDPRITPPGGTVRAGEDLYRSSVYGFGQHRTTSGFRPAFRLFSDWYQEIPRFVGVEVVLRPNLELDCGFIDPIVFDWALKDPSMFKADMHYAQGRTDKELRLVEENADNFAKLGFISESKRFDDKRELTQQTIENLISFFVNFRVSE